jgi:transcription elongation factor Elf1
MAAPPAWASSAGRERCLALLAERFPLADASAMTETWWTDHVKGQASKLSLHCGSCGASASPTIKNLAKGQGLGCHCSGGPRWTTLEGRERCLALLAATCPEANCSRMTDAWWTEHVKGHSSKLDIICGTCGSRATPAIFSLVKESVVAVLFGHRVERGSRLQILGLCLKDALDCCDTSRPCSQLSMDP